MSLSGHEYSTTRTKEGKVVHEILKSCTSITGEGKHKHDNNENCVISTPSPTSDNKELPSEIASPGQEHICEVTSNSKPFLPICVLNRNPEQPDLWTVNLKFKTCCEEKEYYKYQKEIKMKKMMEKKKEKEKEKERKEMEKQNQMIEKPKVMEWSEVIEMQKKYANIPKPDIDISPSLITPVFFSSIRAIEQQWLEETVAKSKSTTSNTVIKKVTPGDEKQLKEAIASILPKK